MTEPTFKSVRPEIKARLIANIRTLEELDGYEAEAGIRGVTSEEVMAISSRRRELESSG